MITDGEWLKDHAKGVARDFTVVGLLLQNY